MNPIKIILSLVAALFTVGALTRIPVSSLDGTSNSGNLVESNGTYAVYVAPSSLPVFTSSNNGLAPAYPNDATKFLNGTGGYTVPTGTGGTVTGVTWSSVPSWLTASVANSTTTPALTLTANSQSANLVLNSGSGGVPTFSALVAAMIPSIDTSKLTTGQLTLARGGSGADLSATGPGFLRQSTLGATVTVSGFVAADWAAGGAQGSLPYLAGSSATAYLGAGTSGQLLTTKGTSANPVWSSWTAPTSVAAGDIWYGSGTNILTALTAGSNGQYLKLASGVPTWAAGTNVVGGANTNVQYNSSGSVAGSGNFTFDGSSITATQGSTSVVGVILKAAGSATVGDFDMQDSSGNVLLDFNGRLFHFQGHSAAGGVFVGRDDYPASGNIIGGYNFATSSSGSYVTPASFFAKSAENWSGTNLGTDVGVQTAANTTTAQIVRQWWRQNGDVELNGAESALSTSATGGFTFIPNMAGFPTGAPSSRTGNSAIVHDSTDDCICVYNGVWTLKGGGSSATYSGNQTVTIALGVRIINGTTTTGQSEAFTLPSAAAYKGETISAYHQGTAGTMTVNGTSVTLNTIAGFLSDGTNWLHGSAGTS